MERKVTALGNLNSIDYRIYLSSKSGPTSQIKERNTRIKDYSQLNKEKKTSPKSGKNHNKRSIQKYKLR